MKLETIEKHWEEDSQIDRQHLTDAALKCSRLHSKYHMILNNERNVLSVLEFELQNLRYDKFEFFHEGPTRQTKERGWSHPKGEGRMTITEANKYVDRDNEVQQLTLKVAIQNSKVEFVMSIISAINSMGFNVKTAVDFARFTAGN